MFRSLLERPLVMPIWGKVAFASVALQGVLQACLDPAASLTPLEKAVVCAAGLVYVALACLDRAREKLLPGPYFLVQHTLGLLLPWLGHGFTAMCGLPVVSQSGLVLPGLYVLIPAAIHALNVFAACHVTMPGPFGMQMTYTFVVATVFVMAFTHAVANELRTREKLDAASRELAAHAEQAEELATMRERTRIARELHDSLGHTLTAAHVHLLVAERDLASNVEQARAALQTVQQVVRAGLEDLRQTVRALHALPTELESLEHALEQLVSAHQSPNLQASLTLVGTPRPLPQHVTLALYRVAQEALTNVVKHARAREVTMELTYSATGVELRVRDDGIGLAPNVSEGFGLRGIRARAASLDGSLELQSQGGLQLTLRASA